MSKATKKSLLYALGVLALIAFAMWLRYASRHILHSPAVSHLRSGIYVFLFSVWCYSLWIRIVQTQVRRYLLAISPAFCFISCFKLCLPCGGFASCFLPFDSMAFIAFWSVCAVSFPVLM